MRINKYLAQSTFLSRRSADIAVQSRRVCINGIVAMTGDQVLEGDVVTLDDRAITPTVKTTTIILNKPVGYVVSRKGQGSETIYNLLPAEYQPLNPVGRLDKDSSGLLLMTNDGQLANDLTHPSKQKQKVYQIELSRPLERKDYEMVVKRLVNIGDPKLSGFELSAISAKRPLATVGSSFLPSTRTWQATLTEGRNRQIRRTFASLGYGVATLHRTQFDDYELGTLALGATQLLS